MTPQDTVTTWLHLSVEWISCLLVGLSLSLKNKGFLAQLDQSVGHPTESFKARLLSRLDSDGERGVVHAKLRRYGHPCSSDAFGHHTYRAYTQRFLDACVSCHTRIYTRHHSTPNDQTTNPCNFDDTAQFTNLVLPDVCLVNLL